MSHDRPHLHETCGEVSCRDTEGEGRHVGGLARGEVDDGVPLQERVDTLPCGGLDWGGVRLACGRCECLALGRSQGAGSVFRVAPHELGGLRGVGMASSARCMGTMADFLATGRLDRGLLISTTC